MVVRGSSWHRIVRHRDTVEGIGSASVELSGGSQVATATVWRGTAGIGWFLPDMVLGVRLVGGFVGLP